MTSVDVFQPEQQRTFDSTGLRIENQPAHFVTLLKILDESIAAQPLPSPPKLRQEARLVKTLPLQLSRPRTKFRHWAITGTSETGWSRMAASLKHTYTQEGSFAVHLCVDGADGLPFNNEFSVTVKGSMPLPTPKRALIDKGSL